MTAARPALHVRAARLHGARRGDAARLQAALSEATPAATGVPDGALLLIRRLAVPVPLARADGFGGALVAGIRAARASARRPGEPGNGDLYFPDAAALEIALVRTALAGGAPDPLLIAHVPGASQPLQRWRRQWLQQPLALAPLLVQLDAAGLAAPWLARFAPEELAAAAGRLAKAHGMADRSVETLRSALAAPVLRLAPARHLAGLPLAVQGAIARAVAASAGDEGQDHPNNPAAWLIAMASMAATRPDMLASPALARALPRPGGLPSLARPARAGTVPGMPAMADAPARPPRTSGRNDPLAPIRPPPAPQPHASAAMPPPPICHTPLPSPAVPILPAPTETRLAGLFFLLNALSAMGLVASIAAPPARLPGLSPFALLWLLGRHWGGGAFLADPLAPLLRQMAGLGPREGAAAQFDPPRWRVPAAWLAPWPRQRRRLIRRGRRWHGAGFPLDDPAPAPTLAGRRRRWLADLARYLAARLGAALTLPADEARALLLHRPGRLRIEDDRLIVSLSLDAHPLALRLAGLDRDPGRLIGTTIAVGFEFA